MHNSTDKQARNKPVLAQVNKGACSGDCRVFAGVPKALISGGYYESVADTVNGLSTTITVCCSKYPKLLSLTRESASQNIFILFKHFLPSYLVACTFRLS